MKAEPFEDVFQEEVVLEAIPAATRAHELVVDAIEINPDTAAEQDIQILEGHRHHMRAQDPLQRGACRLTRALPSNAREVALE